MYPPVKNMAAYNNHHTTKPPSKEKCAATQIYWIWILTFLFGLLKNFSHEKSDKSIFQGMGKCIPFLATMSIWELTNSSLILESIVTLNIDKFDLNNFASTSTSSLHWRYSQPPACEAKSINPSTSKTSNRISPTLSSSSSSLLAFVNDVGEAQFIYLTHCAHHSSRSFSIPGSFDYCFLYCEYVEHSSLLYCTN